MVVVIEARARQPLRLLIAERTERHAGFHSHRLHAFNHLFQVGHIALVRVFPRGTHAETGRTGGFGLTRGGQYLLHFHQTFRLQAGLVARALRAIFTVFRAGPGFDRQQRTDLHLARVEVLTMHLLRFKHQFKKRLIKQRLRLCNCPALSHYVLQKRVSSRQKAGVYL